MPIEMPEPVAGYFAAERDHDADVLARCFADDGMVRDAGHTVHGTAVSAARPRSSTPIASVR
jgi:hypothetical protein